MAGHSKWKQIRHKKAITDAKKGQLFGKVVREIMVAVREGGPRPETNTRLRTALERAKSSGLPKDNIERALSRAGGTAEDAKLQEFLYEATAAGGVLILVEGITDNTNRTIAEIKHILSGRSARLANPGSLLWNFEKIGTLEIEMEEGSVPAKEELELGIIDAGASDFHTDGQCYFVETEFTKRDAVRSELEKRRIPARETGHDYKAKNSVALSDEVREGIETLLDILSSHDDVQEVYTNIKNL